MVGYFDQITGESWGCDYMLFCDENMLD